ncbi:MAG: winged helix-turn-helix transcriptional regulator [Thaumarchaeota archaeon]|nr:winged helix-turn-helix transcriptional regulator [Nitrososphaerota archaeon]
MDTESNNSFLDSKTSLILLATSNSKSAIEVSKECHMPLSTTYRKLDKLLQLNMVKITGIIKDGTKCFLFTSNKKGYFFKNDQRVISIMNIIIENPGINFREIARLSGLTHGIVSHYLFHLEKNGLLQAKRRNNRVWFFPIDLPVSSMDLVIELRNNTSYSILLLLLEKKYAAFSDFTKIINKSSSSISIRLSRLASLGFVNKAYGLRSVYCLKDREMVIAAISKIKRR